MNNTQKQKAEVFKSLHDGDRIFVIPNPWDAGSAKILTALGFEALTTTSAGLAYALGRADGKGLITREETIANARAIVNATELPVSADLENGFGDDPEDCAETIRMAADAGVVGGSIEDATGRSGDPIYSFDLSVARIKAAVSVVRNLPFPFMLCARAENLIHERMDLKDTIKRLVAFAEAGADVLYAPGLTSASDIKRVVQAVSPKPLNVLTGLGNLTLNLNELAELGVRRVSLGSSLAREAYGALYHTAGNIARHHQFHSSKETISYAELNTMFHKS